MSLPFSDEQIARFWSKVDKTPGLGRNGDCWEWRGFKDKRGYGKVSKNYWHGQQLAHRVAYWLTHGSLNPGLNVLHRCDNPSCVNAQKHLYEGTHADNGRDKKQRGRASRLAGDKNGTARLSWTDVNQIRRSFNQEGSSMLSLAKKYDVDKKTISNILFNRQWKDSSYSPPTQDGKGKAKIDSMIAREIRRLYSLGGYSQRDLANQFDISLKTANRVLLNESFFDPDYLQRH